MFAGADDGLNKKPAEAGFYSEIDQRPNTSSTDFSG